MNWKHLLWIIPMCLLIGMVVYASLDNTVEKTYMEILEPCIAYETDIDRVYLLLTSHCMTEYYFNGTNKGFCEEFNNLQLTYDLEKQGAEE